MIDPDAMIAKLDDAIKELKKDTQRVWSRHQLWTGMKTDEGRRHDELLEKVMETDQASKEKVRKAKARREEARTQESPTMGAQEASSNIASFDEGYREDVAEVDAYSAEVEEEVAEFKKLLINQAATIDAELVVVNYWIERLSHLLD